ncbi:sulfite exporter TauE/SafE family protein [Methylomonas sp. SURF-1]|uniref:Sulfite exporter TauE/SafE family protein n=1 Tax=Methylomonas aurea TaxID=2952224 RepID=A0ABT1UNU4_9GAMM|nr:sulfite exporter TauE/SafE family protein [Methylomonas sp. SURF-1]MCQ8183066.1 sulfite exporter TauE/SafE family protein [Methylomonas sp. SURF-1]
MTSGIAKPGSGTVFRKMLSIGFAGAGVGLILWLDSWFLDHAGMPDLTGDLNFGLLFLIGFLTSFHCVGMCGPLLLGYIANNTRAGQHSHVAHLLYGIGKTLSYSSIGALFGAFGAIVAFTPFTQGAVGMAAGVFLLLFGLHMLEVFPSLNHFQFKTPGCVVRFVGAEYRKHGNPFVIGLLNGLMIICGPLQAMYVTAAGSGSWAQGAAILFFFGLGTLPLLMGFGFLTSSLSANLTPKLLKASGVIVMALGVIMFNRGLSVTGSGWDFNTLIARISLELVPTPAKTPSCDNEQTIHMEVLATRFAPNTFTLRKGIPVKWVINAKELNECNREIVVRDYGLDIKLQKGAQVIEFTPPTAGVVPWSCWMGMIPGTFIVVEQVPPLETGTPAASNMAETAGQRLLRQFRQQWQNILN